MGIWENQTTGNERNRYRLEKQDRAGNKGYGDWIEFHGKSGGITTQRPAVLAIGPAGENLSRMACLIHDAGSGSGQGGFGAVWGSKSLKAVSVIGTGGIHIHDPRALMRARLWQTDKYAFDLENPKKQGPDTSFFNVPRPGTLWGRPPGSSRPHEGQRPQACVGCHSGCRARYENGLGNEATCAPTSFYFAASTLDIQRQACDLLNKYGINAFEAGRCLIYLNDLNRRGVLGPGKEIDFPYWGFPNHFDPRTELEWGYGSILGDRDINEHGINTIFMDVWVSRFMGKQPRATAEETVKIYTEPKFLNAVTGKNFTFLDGIEPGKKIWNLDHAIWTLQGRHRDMVHFADYIYRVPYAGFSFMPSSMTSRRNGKWEYTDIYGRCMDREKFEEFKTRFYRLEGWDPDTGYPSRSTLTGLPLEYVADELEKNGKLGKG